MIKSRGQIPLEPLLSFPYP